jgi:ribosomal protein S13
MEIEEKVLKDRNFQSLKRIEFLISDRIKQIEDQFEEMKAVEGEKTLLAKILIDIIEDIMEWRKE